MLSLLYWLKELRTAPLPLFVRENSLTDDVRRGLDTMLAPAGRSYADYLVRVPHLSQAALSGGCAAAVSAWPITGSRSRLGSMCSNPSARVAGLYHGVKNRS